MQVYPSVMGYIRLVLVLCVGLAGLQLASTAPSTLAASAADAAPTPAAVDTPAPYLGTRYRVYPQNCNMQGIIDATIVPAEAVKFSDQLVFEEVLTREDDKYTIEDYVIFKRGDMKIGSFKVKNRFRNGQKFKGEDTAGMEVKYTLTLDGNKLTKVWSRGGLHGTTVMTFTPEALQTLTEVNGQSYHCSFKPVSSENANEV